MLLSAVSHLRSATLTSLVSLFLFGLVVPAGVLLAPTTVQAQEKKDEEKKDDEDRSPENPVVHFFKSIGIPFGLIFAAISVGMVALIIILILELRLGDAMPKSFVEDFLDLVNKQTKEGYKQAFALCQDEGTYIARVLTAGMRRLKFGIDDAREAMAAANDSEKAKKDAWISYLGIIGTLGPLLGLVGTVSGMIGAFKKLGEQGGAPKAADLAGEISHALVVTLVGVAIACPAIFFFTFFKNRLTNISVTVSSTADDLLTQVHYSSKKTEGSTSVQAKG